jgi:CheY-like chemotaxis protein
VVARSVETARPLINARRHTLVIEQPDEPVYVNGDSTRLSQVLQNLLVNAAKYTPQGGSIRLVVTPIDSFVNVSISDNGRGLASEQLESIFQLFMQTDTGTSAGAESGLGIGLTLARSLAEMHGGSIEATSPGLGQGSTFTVRLPVSSHGAVAEQDPGQDGPAGGLRVLVIDDNRDSADSATDVLRLLGNQVDCAYDGETGVAAARRLQPDVILLDLAMPGMDGFEARRRLREHPGGSKAFLVAMTGFGNEEDKRRTRAAGFDAHLTKPVELDALVTLLNEARGRKPEAEA